MVWEWKEKLIDTSSLEMVRANEVAVAPRRVEGLST